MHKKISGIKRHIAVDTRKLPHAIAITAAEITDRKGALQAMNNIRRQTWIEWLANDGYVEQPFANGSKNKN